MFEKQVFLFKSLIYKKNKKFLMTVLPQYDEFGIYTTVDDIKFYVTELFEFGVSSEEEIVSKCINEFGRSNFNLIEMIVYGED